MQSNAFHRIAAALDLEPNCGEAECLKAIEEMKPIDPEHLQAVYDGKIEGVTWDPSRERLIMELEDGYELGGEQRMVLEFRPAKAGDLRKAGKAGGSDSTGMDTSFALISRLSNLPMEKCDEDLTIGDIAKFGSVLPFLQASRRTRSKLREAQ
jgi:hypothetical protein